MPKAFLKTEDGTEIPCMFNPESLSVSRSNSWQSSSAPGRGVPTLRYEGASSGTFSLSLFFDTTDDGTAVTTHTSKLLKLMEVDSGLPGSSDATQNARPPWVVFNWGDLHSFKAVITSLSLNFTYFSATGVPLRAKADLSLTQYQEELAFGPQNPTSGTPFPHRTHRVQPGETLDRISAMHYGDATMWRRIASANGIEDPLALRAGTLLAIPELH
ncbi:MAG: LysM peptidoglycan-binding domain-containing protein [Acidimicrobiales bacterium]